MYIMVYGIINASQLMNLLVCINDECFPEKNLIYLVTLCAFYYELFIFRGL